MSEVTTTTTLDGMFKQQYGDSISMLVPEVAYLQKNIAFVKKSAETGNYYNQPALLSDAAGFTYAGPNAGAFDLNSAISLQMGNARLLGSQILLRAALDYESAARAITSAQAFESSAGLLIENMADSTGKRIEIDLLYGQDGLGRTSTITASTSTVSVVTITAATWSAGTWSGLENAVLQFYNGSSLVSSGADSYFTITSIDPDARTITVTGTSGGSTTLVALSGTALTPYFLLSYGKSMIGIKKIMTNTGDQFGIDASLYSLWRANDITVSGALTLGKIQSAISKAVARGLNEEIVVLVSPATFAVLITNEAALRQYDSSYNPSKGYENGAENITFFSANGRVRIVPHILVRDGDCFGFPLKRAIRVGATEMTFMNPGMPSEGRIFRQLESKAGYEVRCYVNMALLFEMPARCFYIHGFTNPS